MAVEVVLKVHLQLKRVGMVDRVVDQQQVELLALQHHQVKVIMVVVDFMEQINTLVEVVVELEQ
jgi:hypothetical protein